MDIGKRIQVSREEMGFSQKRLAEIMGISAARLSMWETGKREPSAESLKMLSKALHVSVDYLIDNYPMLPDEEEGPISLDVARTYTAEERKMMADFRGLDSFGRNAVHVILEAEKFRVDEQHLTPGDAGGQED